MSALETLSLASLAIGAACVFRFVWLDSLRFKETDALTDDAGVISRGTAQRLALQADAARLAAEPESLPRAA
jgi:uncharacterized membrane protein YgcG